MNINGGNQRPRRLFDLFDPFDLLDRSEATPSLCLFDLNGTVLWMSFWWKMRVI